MNIEQAKRQLDKVISKGRVHFYKPFQIAEILRRNRSGELTDLRDLESYKNASRHWRDEVSVRLVGRRSTSSARYQDDIFNESACPPSALAALGEYNKATDGGVEAYIYRMFEAKLSSIGIILGKLREATTSTFDLSTIINTFEQRPGLKRSIDKVFEITVYALFSTIVRALRLRVSLTVGNADTRMLEDFGDFLNKVAGLKKGETSLIVDAHLFRLGSTNAADLGLDMIANFGLAIQVKHLTLDLEAINDICEGLDAERVVIVCKDTEVTVVDAVIKQLGLSDRLQGVVTFSDLTAWYSMCLSEPHQESLGAMLIADFVREFTNEFPSLDGSLDAFMEERKYRDIHMPEEWSVAIE